MKRILVLALSLILVFSLVACGGGSNEAKDDTSSAGQVENGGSADNTSPANSQNANGENAGSENSEPTFIGTWVHKRTDAEPFPITLTIKADGTAEWKESQDKWVWVDNGDGTIEIATPDTLGYGKDAYLTDDGKLVWEKTLQFGETTLEQITLERQ